MKLTTYAVHTLVLLPSHKQRLVIHISDWLMTITLNTKMPTVIKIEMRNLKTNNPIHCTKIFEKIDLILDTQLIEYICKHFIYWMLSGTSLHTDDIVMCKKRGTATHMVKYLFCSNILLARQWSTFHVYPLPCYKTMTFWVIFIPRRANVNSGLKTSVLHVPAMAWWEATNLLYGR